MDDFITIVEVGPRDGLQNEKQILLATTKIELINRLANCGVPVIEAGSFVSPKWVPQMADTESVLTGLTPLPGTRYPVLVPNLTGFERAIQSGAKEIAVFTAASESFTRRNINCSIDESITRLEPVAEQAKASGIRVRGYVSCVLGCPYEGEIEATAVAAVCDQLMQLGCDEISLGDTIGTGTPAVANALVKTVSSVVPIKQLAVHFHDTYGQALANILACLDAGIRIVDSSVSGLGGCPYAKGASGNVASEDVVYMLHGLGFATGIDLDALANTGDWISKQLQRPNNSKAGLAIISSG
ncbi:MAG: hydroxymethylglutaryl-CoA lyase [Gammaproteobacteria bacterium]|nr:hydroxymethylglutaryl-CoA lyase [Gammaproteobacteria bacterium]